MKYSQPLLLVFLVFSMPFLAEASLRNITAQWEYPEIENITEFRLYNGNVLVCTTKEPEASSLNCNIDLSDGEYDFSVTVVFSDGTETEHSNILSYVFSSDLKALFTIAPVEGPSPLQVAFDGTSSSGTVQSYYWMFGDGESAYGNIVNHTYAVAGVYTVTLKVVDDLGSYDQEYQSVTVNEPVVINEPPLAVISSSAAIGYSPLLVNFDGSDSSDSDGTIILFDWDMGDGETSNSVNLDHVYSLAGTFHPSLTVTDNGGLKDSTSTPVLVQPPIQSNVPPIAVIKASEAGKSFPLKVFLNGGSSYDADGSIVRYAWNFGDGSIGSGKTIWHTFVEEGSYRVSLKVSDDKGAVSTAAWYSVKASSANGDKRGAMASLMAINRLLLNDKKAEESNSKQQ